MTTTPVSLQDLRRKVYAKAKAEPHWRFWGCRARNRRGFGWERWSTQWLHATLDCSTAAGSVWTCGKSSQLDRSHNPWHEANR